MQFPLRRVSMPTPETAPPGRQTAIPTARQHFVYGRPLLPPYPENHEEIVFGLGCFWGAERLFWELSDSAIWITAVGYSGGYTPNPTYKEVCGGTTGHAEVVRVIYDPRAMPLETLLRVFWESHYPTQGFRQGNDIGTQYRSTIYTTTPEQALIATQSRADYEAALKARGLGAITTDIEPAGPFYFAEDYHQQYLAKVPDGYCGLAGTGVACPMRPVQAAS